MDSHLLHEARFWEAICFIVAALIVIIKGRAGFSQFIKSRIDDVRESLDRAEKLRQEAQDMLDHQKYTYKKIESQSQDILKNAQEEATLYRDETRQKMDALISSRERQAFDRIKQMEDKALRDAKSYTVDLAVQGIVGFLQDHKDAKIADPKVELMLKELKKAL